MKPLAYSFFVGGMWLFATVACMAQDKEYQYVHQGNKLLEKGNPTEAETFYQRALTLSPNNGRAYYDLGNSLFAQDRKEEAMKAYGKGAGMEKNKLVKSMAFHNMGVLCQTERNLTQAIEYYKEALRNNPADEEARYNLVLCQHQLKGGQDGQQQEQQDKDDKEGEDKQQQQEQQQDNQQQQQPAQQQSQMSKSNAEQLLDLSKQEEEKTRKKIQNVSAPKRLEKNW